MVKMDITELEDVIESIWINEIRKEVCSGNLSEESDLHCSFYCWLRQRLEDDKSISILSEPEIHIHIRRGEDKWPQPDLVVKQDGENLIGIEFKTLRWKPTKGDWTAKILNDAKKLMMLKNKGFKRGYILWFIKETGFNITTVEELKESFDKFKNNSDNLLKEPEYKNFIVEGIGAKGLDDSWEIRKSL